MNNSKNHLNQKQLIILIILLIISFYLGILNGDPNKNIKYGDSGLPKNCRAIISANIESYENGLYSAEDIINSIKRNCGATGHSW